MPRLNLAILSVILVSVVTGPASAEHRSRDLTYSPDHWPARWSSAIRQQQGGQFPTRKLENIPPPELPVADSASEVSEHDLFSSPATGHFGRSRQRDQRQNASYFREDARRNESKRQSAFAYYGMPPLNPASFYSSPANGLSNIAIDPVLGHPGIGIPIMPGTPYGYPFIGYSPAYYPGGFYPGSMGAWNPPFGMW